MFSKMLKVISPSSSQCKEQRSTIRDYHYLEALDKSILKIEFAKTFAEKKFLEVSLFKRKWTSFNKNFQSIWSREQLFSFLEKSYVAGNWHTNGKQDGKSASEKWNTIALLSVKILANKFFFFRNLRHGQKI